MKKVVTTPAVDLALRTLGPDEVRRIQAWFIHLANWDGDPFVRENSHVLDEVPGVRVFRTSTDTRIFFTIEDDTITVLDVAKKQSIITTGDRTQLPTLHQSTSACNHTKKLRIVDAPERGNVGHDVLGADIAAVQCEAGRNVQTGKAGPNNSELETWSIEIGRPVHTNKHSLTAHHQTSILHLAIPSTMSCLLHKFGALSSSIERVPPCPRSALLTQCGL